jgi:hypothetical protein
MMTTCQHNVSPLSTRTKSSFGYFQRKDSKIHLNPLHWQSFWGYFLTGQLTVLTHHFHFPWSRSSMFKVISLRVEGYPVCRGVRPRWVRCQEHLGGQPLLIKDIWKPWKCFEDGLKLWEINTISTCWIYHKYSGTLVENHRSNKTNLANKTICLCPKDGLVTEVALYNKMGFSTRLRPCRKLHVHHMKQHRNLATPKPIGLHAQLDRCGYTCTGYQSCLN